MPSTGRVLVIDDNKEIHNDFQKIFSNSHDEELEELEAAFLQRERPNQSRQIEIDSAYQGKLGFELVKTSVEENNPYNIAFVDMRMPPGWDGVVTIEHLWDVAPDLFVVICTAFSDRSWKEINKHLGQKGRFLILRKPFDIIEVTQLVHAAIGSQTFLIGSSGSARFGGDAGNFPHDAVRCEVNKIRSCAKQLQKLNLSHSDEPLERMLKQIVEGGENLMRLVEDQEFSRFP